MSGTDLAERLEQGHLLHLRARAFRRRLHNNWPGRRGQSPTTHAPKPIRRRRRDASTRLMMAPMLMIAEVTPTADSG